MTAGPFLGIEELDARLPAWRRALAMGTDDACKLSRAALLVLDMQNEFLLPSGQLPVWGGPAATPRVRRLVDLFRSAGQPVIYTRHLCIEPYKHAEELGVMRWIPNPDTFLCDGHPGAEIHADLKPEAGEPVIVKYRYSGFYDTPLDTLLRVRGIEQVVITGVATNICCETTAHDAFFRGFKVLFTMDGTGGTSEEAHLATLKTIQMAYGSVGTIEQVARAVGMHDETREGEIR